MSSLNLGSIQHISSFINKCRNFNLKVTYSKCICRLKLTYMSSFNLNKYVVILTLNDLQMLS